MGYAILFITAVLAIDYMLNYRNKHIKAGPLKNDEVKK